MADANSSILRLINDDVCDFVGCPCPGSFAQVVSVEALLFVNAIRQVSANER